MKRLAATLCLIAVPALADIAPEPGWKETCTIADQCKKGEEGATCTPKDEVCRKKLEADGYVKRCGTRNSWKGYGELVYCRAKKK